MRLQPKRASLRRAKWGFMIRFLFRGLTRDAGRGQALFDRVVGEARKRHWYEAGEVPDTIDGRFSVLATTCALFIIRLERSGEGLDPASVALTERFVEAMDVEHREIGLNDPGLGRRVRKLLGSLERRVDEWRGAIHGENDWTETVISSLYHGEAPKDEALKHSSDSLEDLWNRLSEASAETFEDAAA